ncbi:glutamine amidotransferase family protein [Rhodobacteraceae bacterium NNCM2]|nr:glutamine amidotransferase family protein [Coraliihabitans acroporae]
MCGIVGLFAKTPGIEAEMGAHLSAMLVTMSDRGPDSAGFAIYRDAVAGQEKLTVQSADPEVDFEGLEGVLNAAGVATHGMTIAETHAILRLDAGTTEAARAALAEHRPGIRVMSRGNAIEIYKEVGLPQAVSDRFNLSAMSGRHAVGHTRMATESAVTTLGAHPFSTAPDQCLVHNGSMSNHNNMGRELRRAGRRIETENDTEVAAAYLSWRMDQGLDLGQALEHGLKDYDGFYTFLVGTETGFGVLRDPIACKPAVMAETDDYVAFGSEYRALVNLPGIATARVWEPEPATVYFWKH